VLDEEETFDMGFKVAWQSFMSECLLRMVKEILDEENKLIKIMDLNRITLKYDIYDASGTLKLNDDDFKTLLNDELGNDNIVTIDD
jgi:hypothetical protein